MVGEPKSVNRCENALRGFNSSVGTISYSWSEITKAGSLTVGGGITILIFSEFIMQLLVLMEIRTIGLGVQRLKVPAPRVTALFLLEIMLFDRTSGRIQLLGPDSQTVIFFAGYQDKFYGWPACIQQIQISMKQKIIKFCCI